MPSKSKKKQRHPGKKKGKLSPTKRRYAKARAEGATMRKAAAIAGLDSARSRNGVTGAEWEKNDPLVQQAIIDYTEQQMTSAEVNGRLAAMARGELVAKSTDKFGDEYHELKALETLGHHQGLRRSHVDVNLHERPDLSKLTDDELEKLIEIEKKARGENAGDGTKAD